MFDKIQQTEHESVFFHYDKHTNLKAIVAIHDTTLGPSLGGLRILDYQNEADALNDVLRLSKGMTYKAAYSGLDLGGGKAVILGDANKIKTEAFLRSYGKFVESLAGNYITAPDVNSNVHDMVFIAKETNHVVGLPAYCGGSDDPSEFTAYGVFVGIKAGLKYVYGSEDLSNKKIGIEGVGKVGHYLMGYLANTGCKIFYTDISKNAIERIKKDFKTAIYVDPKDFYDLEMDIYSPCALGATLNDSNIKRLKCKLIAGGANNQLEDTIKHSKLLMSQNILYCPDFVINCGGLTNVFNEYSGNYNKKSVFSQLDHLYYKLLYLFDTSTKNKVPTNITAEKICEERIASIRKAGLAYNITCN